jgi:hypothetical protein
MAHSSETELKIVSAGENLQRENGRVSSMDSAVPDARLSFRVYIIRLHGPENDPMVRVLLVETSKTKSIYEVRIVVAMRAMGRSTHSWIIPRNVLSVLRKRRKQRRMATIKGERVSRREIESIGLQRLDR